MKDIVSKMRWVGHVAFVREYIHAERILDGKTEGKEQLRRMKCSA